MYVFYTSSTSQVSLVAFQMFTGCLWLVDGIFDNADLDLQLVTMSKHHKCMWTHTFMRSSKTIITKINKKYNTLIIESFQLTYIWDFFFSTIYRLSSFSWLNIIKQKLCLKLNLSGIFFLYSSTLLLLSNSFKRTEREPNACKSLSLIFLDPTCFHNREIIFLLIATLSILRLPLFGIRILHPYFI